MKKLIALCMVLVLSATALCACSNGEENKENTTSTESSTEEKTTSTEAQNSINIEDVDLFDLSFELDGVVYTLPCDFSEFEKNGWHIREIDKNNLGEAPTLSAHDRSVYITIEKDGYTDNVYNEISISFINTTSTYVDLMDCQVCGVKVELRDDTRKTETIPIKFPGGLSIDRDLKSDDIIAEYGEPDEYSEDIYVHVNYYKQEGDYRKLFETTIYGEDRKFSDLVSIHTLGYEYSPETAVEDSTESEDSTEASTESTEAVTSEE